MESKKSLTTTDVFCSNWAAMIRVAMLRDPKHRGIRFNEVIENQRKDKVNVPSLGRRYLNRYRSI